MKKEQEKDAQELLRQKSKFIKEIKTSDKKEIIKEEIIDYKEDIKTISDIQVNKKIFNDELKHVGFLYNKTIHLFHNDLLISLILMWNYVIFH